MKWIEICIITSKSFADIVSLFLIEEGSEGTVIKDNSDLKELYSSNIIWDYVDESILESNDERVFVSGFFPLSHDYKGIVENLTKLAKNSKIDSAPFEISIKELDSIDWENEWKKYYEKISFSTFDIVPEWLKKQNNKNKKSILINPGLAFGTGNHETTYMCLQFLDELDLSNKTVIDLGCGSGILGVTAAIKGAESVLLTDIDENAIRCSADNIKLNGLTCAKTLVKDLFIDTFPYKADLLIANLTAPLLIKAKEGILKHLNPYANLIISGILNEYNVEVLNSYLKNFELIESRIRGEWTCNFLKLRKN